MGKLKVNSNVNKEILDQFKDHLALRKPLDVNDDYWKKEKRIIRILKRKREEKEKLIKMTSDMFKREFDL